MQRNGIAGKFQLAARRLRTVFATIATAAILTAAAPRASASVEYDFTGGGNFTYVTGIYTTADRVTGDIVLPSTLAPSSVTFLGPTSTFSFSFSDGVNTITNSDVPGSSFGAVLDTNASGQVTGSTVDFSTSSGARIGQTLEPENPEANESFGSQAGTVGHSGQGYSFTTGTWSGPITIQPPTTPSLYVTLTPGGTPSADTPPKPTSQIATLILSSAPVPGGHLIDNLPTDVTTLAQAASVLGYQGFDWVSKITGDPNPDFSAIAQSTPLTYPFNDPPQGGYAGETPSTSTAGRYPFYTAFPITSTRETCTTPTSCVPVETSTALLFEDTPIDSRLRESGGHTSFDTSLVGVLTCGTPNVGECNSAGYEPGPTLFDFTWEDNFDGTLGGVTNTVVLSNALYADPNSGTGGVTITSIDGVLVPEPSSLALLFIGLSAAFSMTTRTGRGANSHEQLSGHL